MFASISELMLKGGVRGASAALEDEEFLEDPGLLVKNSVPIFTFYGLQGYMDFLAEGGNSDLLAQAVAQSMWPLVEGNIEFLENGGDELMADLGVLYLAMSLKVGAKAEQAEELQEIVGPIRDQLLPKIVDELRMMELKKLDPPAYKKERKARRKAYREAQKALPRFSISKTPDGRPVYKNLVSPVDQEQRQKFLQNIIIESGFEKNKATQSIDLKLEGGKSINVKCHFIGEGQYGLENGGMLAIANISHLNIPTARVSKAMRDYPYHENNLSDSIEDYQAVTADGELVDLTAQSIWNLTDEQGRKHTLMRQDLKISLVSVQTFLDLWVEQDFLKDSASAMVVPWEVVPTHPQENAEWASQFSNVDSEKFLNELAGTKGLFSGGALKNSQNTGIWQIIDSDGDNRADQIIWAASISETAGKMKLGTKSFAQNVADMTQLLMQYKD